MVSLIECWMRALGCAVWWCDSVSGAHSSSHYSLMARRSGLSSPLHQHGLRPLRWLWQAS
jgi:hypothetical protein